MLYIFCKSKDFRDFIEAFLGPLNYCCLQTALFLTIHTFWLGCVSTEYIKRLLFGFFFSSVDQTLRYIMDDILTINQLSENQCTVTPLLLVTLLLKSFSN